jgi:23S rRNA (cytidine1920-2'-O)/16S rRNA (cytidine1409-2'-O)-methyltransferase
MRLDHLLVSRGLAATRARAQELIRRGLVRVGEDPDAPAQTKPAARVSADASVRLTAELPYVSRAGEKLAAFLDAFPQVDPAVARFLDVGASTGGFTDCLLRRSAREAVCVDVGHGQLHPTLHNDPRVHNLEGINARDLDAAGLPHPDYPLVVMDLSFISLTKVLPAVWPLVSAEGTLIALVKPQFESDRATLDAGSGIVRADADRQAALERVLSCVEGEFTEARLIGTCPSPIEGGDGNREYLAGWRRQSPPR